MDEEGGYLYKHIKMLYEEDYHPEPVQTHGTEDAISLVSSLLLSCLEHEFYPCPFQLVLAFTKVVSHLLFSKHEGPLIRLLSLSVYMINKTGSAENKVKSL